VGENYIIAGNNIFKSSNGNVIWVFCSENGWVSITFTIWYDSDSEVWG